jgi:pantoate--beta-alanine ligase
MKLSPMTNTASSDFHQDRDIKIIHDPAEMQACAAELIAQGKRIAFVPTMGYLHDGHLSLLREGRRQGDVLVLSIFVNPIQFGEGDDFSVYPRDFEHDNEGACSVGVDIIFAPDVEDLYPPAFSTYVEVGGLTDTLCGRNRPGHFRGVTTVVSKLFNIVKPGVAIFGQKDFQQLAVIRRMVQDLHMDIEICGMPIVREEDGLAMSSRNVYLDSDQRTQALALSDSLRLGCALARAGERNAAEIIRRVRERIELEPEARIDYVQICHDETLQDMADVSPDSVLLLAVRIGNTRLIDNHYLFEESELNDAENA